MRVNHVGEVCAQALYAGQSLTARSSQLKAFNQHSAEQEKDHLLWTYQRLKALNGRPSVLNPVWYLGSWALGCAAGLMGDRVSLSFVKETENQVEAHLSSHLDRLPINDLASRAIVAKMAEDEAAHADQAVHLGGAPLPTSAVHFMRTSAKVMTTVAHYV
jgi:3-demethoxyubiquinol 3-hydroxylase